MMIQVKYPAAVMSVFLWIGFVCAISFLEAWLKFKAPGITLSLGLGIGRLVFSVLNKIEWVLAIAIAVNIIISKDGFVFFDNFLYCLAVVLLVIQTAWLLPAMDARAEMVIQGQNLAPSSLHFYYVAMELIKVSALFIFGIKLFRSLE